MTTAHLHRRNARLLLLQDPDNLLFAKPAALHTSDSLRVGLYSFLVTFQGSTSPDIREVLSAKQGHSMLRMLARSHFTNDLLPPTLRQSKQLDHSNLAPLVPIEPIKASHSAKASDILTQQCQSPDRIGCLTLGTDLNSESI